VYLDLNNDSAFDASDVIAYSDNQGLYSFRRCPQALMSFVWLGGGGTDSNRSQRAPPPAATRLSRSIGQSISQIDFGSFATSAARNVVNGAIDQTNTSRSAAIPTDK